MKKKYNSKMWVKKKIKDHFAFTKGNRVRVRRMYSLNRIVIDFWGGSCTTYDYDGNWIAG